MATISVSLASDGSTADVADVNTPINTIVNEINGNLDNANIASGAAIDGSKLADGGVTPAKLQSGTGTSWVWSTYTVIASAGGVGTGGTLVGKFKQVGKTVRFKITGTLGSGGWEMGIVLNLPVTAADSSNSIGPVWYLDTGVASYAGFAFADTATTFRLHIIASGTNGRADSTSNANPFVWGSGDRFIVNGSYEAA